MNDEKPKYITFENIKYVYKKINEQLDNIQQQINNINQAIKELEAKFSQINQ